MADLAGEGSQSPPGDPARPADFHQFGFLSPEVQHRIIGQLVDTSHILNVILANKYLYRLCLGLLYRNLRWSNPVVCADIVRQVEVQRRRVASVASPSMQDGTSMLAPDGSLPPFPTAFNVIPKSLVLSLTYNIEKPNRVEAYKAPYELFADVGGLLNTANAAAGDYIKDNFREDDIDVTSNPSQNLFLRSLNTGRMPLYVSHEDFRLDLPTVLATIQGMDPLSQIPHWDALSQLCSGGERIDAFRFYTSIPLYNQILVTICNFSNLQTLVFYNSNLPPRFYDAILLLPNLRSLVIDTCALPPFLIEGVENEDEDPHFNSTYVMYNPNPRPIAPPIMPTIRDFTSLPITSLTLLNLWSSSIDSYPSRHRAFSPYLTRRTLDRIQVLKLASAQNLTELAVDWDSTSARYFGGVSEDETDTTFRDSTDPLIASFGSSAAAAFPMTYHPGPDAPVPTQSSTTGSTNLTVITTNDPTKKPYVPPLGLTSLTVNMHFRWLNFPHGDPVLWLRILDCSALLSSFLKKFEDEADNAQKHSPRLEHLQIFSHALDLKTLLTWQEFMDKETERRHLEDQGLPSDVGIIPALQNLDSCQGMTSLFFPLHPTILLPHLKTFVGPLHTIPSVLRRSISDQSTIYGLGTVAQKLERLVVWDEMWWANSSPKDWVSKRSQPPTSMGLEPLSSEDVAIFHRSLSAQNLFNILGFGSPGTGGNAGGDTYASEQGSPVNPPLKVLKVPLTEWSEEILYAVSDNLRGLRALEVFYTQGDISEYALLSMGARFLHKLPQLQTLRLWNPGATWKPKRKPKIKDLRLSPKLAQMFEEARRLHPENDPEVEIPHDDHDHSVDEDTVLQCLTAWKQHTPSLRELQLYPGIVWRRHSNNDEWTRREVVREGLDLDLDEFGDEAEVGGWKNGLHWQYWDRDDLVKELWRRGLGLESVY